MASLERTYTILRPTILFSVNVGTQVLPGIDLPLLNHAQPTNWPTGWLKVPFTANGANTTFVNPTADIPSDEIGPLGTEPTGAADVNVSFQAHTAILDLIVKMASLTRTQYSAVTEVQTLTVTGGATAAGTVTITLDGVPFNVATIAATDTAAQVATKIAAATYTGWTAVAGTGANANQVIFTAAAGGPHPGLFAFAANTTGVAANIARSVMGVSLYSRFAQDISIDSTFMLGIEGSYAPNSLKFGGTGGKIRQLFYKVRQTDNPQIAARTLGPPDNLVRPTTTARALTSTVNAGQLVGTGIQETDPYGKFDIFDVSN